MSRFCNLTGDVWEGCWIARADLCHHRFLGYKKLCATARWRCRSEGCQPSCHLLVLEGSIRDLYGGLRFSLFCWDFMAIVWVGVGSSDCGQWAGLHCGTDMGLGVGWVQPMQLSHALTCPPKWLALLADIDIFIDPRRLFLIGNETSIYKDLKNLKRVLIKNQQTIWYYSNKPFYLFIFCLLQLIFLSFIFGDESFNLMVFLP